MLAINEESCEPAVLAVGGVDAVLAVDERSCACSR